MESWMQVMHDLCSSRGFQFRRFEKERVEPPAFDDYGAICSDPNRQKVQPCLTSSQWIKNDEGLFELFAEKNNTRLLRLCTVGS